MKISQKRPEDFSVHNEGSIFLLHPLTYTREWIRENLPSDRMMFGEAVVVEHRFICDLLEGILADGLEVR
jgi:hypothetical protein